MYRIIFSDIDGTLLDTNQRISAGTKQKIQDLEKRGIPFVLVSSRLDGGVFPILEELGIKAPVISCSGAVVRNADGNVIRSLEIPPKKAQEIHDFIINEDKNICCCVYSYDLWLADDKSDPWLINEERITRLSATVGKIADYPDRGGVHKLLCMGDTGSIDRLADKLKQAFPEVCICRSKDTYLEVNHPLATKANAMRFLCENLGIPLSQTVAFGDGDVDLEMIQLAGKGFAMSNASDTVKRGAERITESNDDEGVLKALVRLGL